MLIPVDRLADANFKFRAKLAGLGYLELCIIL